MRPSGATIQLSVFSWGNACARYGLGASCSSLKLRVALKTAVSWKLPALVANGLVARLAGSPRAARTTVGGGAAATAVGAIGVRRPTGRARGAAAVAA